MLSSSFTFNIGRIGKLGILSAVVDDDVEEEEEEEEEEKEHRGDNRHMSKIANIRDG